MRRELLGFMYCVIFAQTCSSQTEVIWQLRCHATNKAHLKPADLDADLKRWSGKQTAHRPADHLVTYNDIYRSLGFQRYLLRFYYAVVPASWLLDLVGADSGAQSAWMSASATFESVCSIFVPWCPKLVPWVL